MTAAQGINIDRSTLAGWVIEPCKLKSVEPQAFIADVIEKIASGSPASRWDELMPCNWAANSQAIAQAA